MSEEEDLEYTGPWIMICQGVLTFVGGLYLVGGLLFGSLYIIVPLLVAPDDPEILVMVPVGVLLLVLSGVVGIVNLAAAVGLGRHKLWGFVLALVLAALYVPSACVLVGGVLVYGLLIDEPTRKVFLK